MDRIKLEKKGVCWNTNETHTNATRTKAHLHESPEDDSSQNRHQSKQRILWRLEHRRAGPNGGCCVHVLEADVGRIEAIVAGHFFDGGVSIFGEFNIDALFAALASAEQETGESR